MEIKCRYLSTYIGKDYCDNKENTDHRSSGSENHKTCLKKRCLAEYCPLLRESNR